MANLYGVDSAINLWYGEATLQAEIDKMGRLFDTVKNNGGNCVNNLIYSDPYLSTSVDFFTGRADMVMTLNDMGVIPYVDVTRAGSDLLHQKGMKYWIQICTNTGVAWSNTLIDANAKAKCNTQIQQIVQQLNPDIVTLVSEPSSPTIDATGGVSVSDQELILYEDWLVALANALRTVKPTVQIAVMGLPWWSTSRIIADGLINRLPSGTIVVGHYYTTNYSGYAPDYYRHAEINYYYAPADGSTITVNVMTPDPNNPSVLIPTPTVVSLAQAKTYLFAEFDTYIQPCLNAGVPFVWEAIGCNTSMPNALQSTKDAMEYCKNKNIGWVASGNPAGGYYVFPLNSPDTLSSFGQAMFSTINPAGNITLPYHDSLTNLTNLQAINGSWNIV